MISIQQIQYIIALSEEGQFQRASEICFVTQPTLSMQIKKVEEFLGGLLFDRSRHPIELTPFGKEIIPIFRDVLIEYDKIEILVEKKEGKYKEEVRMAIIPTISGYMLPDLYNHWKKVLPRVQLTIVELKTEEILIALEERKIDIGILAGPENNPRWRSIPLYQEEIKAFIPNHSEDEVCVDELINLHPWLLTHGNCLRTQMVHFCELNSSFETDDWDYEGGNIHLLERMVEQHGGYTLVPVNFIASNKSNYKTIKSNEGEVPAREIIALVHSKNHKWEYLETIIREIQLHYNSKTDLKYKILSWN